MHFYRKFWLWFIGFALVYCVGVNERENPKSHMEMFQSNIYNYVSIKEYIVHAQGSCACTRCLCMHISLAHAHHSGACTGEASNQGWDLKRLLGWSQALDRCLFGYQAWPLAPPVHAQGCCACTRVLCMHKNLVHTKGSWHFWQFSVFVWTHQFDLGSIRICSYTS